MCVNQSWSMFLSAHMKPSCGQSGDSTWKSRPVFSMHMMGRWIQRLSCSVRYSLCSSYCITVSDSRSSPRSLSSRLLPWNLCVTVIHTENMKIMNATDKWNHLGFCGVPEATIWASFWEAVTMWWVTRNGCYDNSGYLN